jgi:GTP-binding protein
LIQKIQRAAQKRISTGVLNRLLRQAFEANPPPLVKGKRLKLFYAAQTTGDTEPASMKREAFATPELAHAMQISRGTHKSSPFDVPKFVLFVNDALFMTESFRRYLEARIREADPYPGLPIILALRPRGKDVGRR